MHVIGTAGHVDHGKSTLVQAITGIDPDRLKEEKERQLTIDLGFAWAVLPAGHEVGFIDVPGHQDFIENMLAGVGGIDLALLAVAADEGIMPQTREHLAILDLLEVQHGIVCLTKVDLVTDPAWLSLVEDEVRQLLAGTSLADAPILPVSSATGAGLPELVAQIEQLLEATAAKADLDRARLPIDRVFAISGFGTVVTGTLLDGHLEQGAAVTILPQGLPARIRGLQTHKKKTNRAIPGSRVAVNISGLTVDDIQRGDVLVAGDASGASSMIDVHVHLLESAPAALKHEQEVKLFVGSAQRLARLRVLGKANELQPGEAGWLQLLLDSPLYVRRGDRFILRRPSPPATVGGGRVVDPSPSRRHRKRDRRVVARLERLMADDPAARLHQALRDQLVGSLNQIWPATGLTWDEAMAGWQQLLAAGEIRCVDGEPGLPDAACLSEFSWARWREDIFEALTAYHKRHPLRAGMPIEELRSRTDLPAEPFDVMLVALAPDSVVAEAGLIRLVAFEPRLTSQQQASWARLSESLKLAGSKPPSVEAIKAAVGEPAYYYLLEEGRLVQVSDDVAFLDTTYAQIVGSLRQALGERGPMTVAEIRDLLGTTRKYVLPLLERLDAQGITVRDADLRYLGRQD